MAEDAGVTAPLSFIFQPFSAPVITNPTFHPLNYRLFTYSLNLSAAI